MCKADAAVGMWNFCAQSERIHMWSLLQLRDLSEADTTEGSGESPAQKEETAAADKKAAVPEVPAAQDKSPAATIAAAAMTAATAVAKPSAAEEEDEDLEISDEDAAAAEGGESDVDEDWGGDWE